MSLKEYHNYISWTKHLKKKLNGVEDIAGSGYHVHRKTYHICDLLKMLSFKVQ